MTNGTKEWVTIKIPESVRDAARDAGGTYGEIMQAGLKNINGSNNDHTVVSPEQVTKSIRAEIKTISKEVAEEIAECEIEDIERTAEKQTSRVQLEATEYSKIAEEVTHKLEGLQR